MYSYWNYFLLYLHAIDLPSFIFLYNTCRVSMKMYPPPIIIILVYMIRNTHYSIYNNVVLYSPILYRRHFHTNPRWHIIVVLFALIVVYEIPKFHQGTIIDNKSWPLYTHIGIEFRKMFYYCHQCCKKIKGSIWRVVEWRKLVKFRILWIC